VNSSNATAAFPAILVYDGVCALCNSAVRFVLAHDRRGRIGFAALQSDYADALRARHPELEGVDSIVLVRTADGVERVAVRSDAALEVCEELGGAWRLLRMMRLVPRSLRDTLYDFIARRRYQWFGRYDSCPIPEPDVRSRFLD
jgi:predicted DCC family thiol-disulfide oxidoreductase YuxK